VKNQYFGDINDFKKYGLMRALSNHGEIRTVACWMLTPDDGRGDGSRIGYLSKPEEWRTLDPQLFDHLREWVLTRGVRDVRAAETSAILPNCGFAPGVLSDDAGERSRYFEGCLDIARSCELAFFDPDNGIQVKSTLYGRRGSSKYLYWHEIERFWGGGYSLLIYQHFPRVPRDPYIESRARELIRRTGAPEVTSFRTSSVVFLLVPQEDRVEFFRGRSRVVDEVWGQQMQVAHHFPG
jgi:hypothetical protein